MRPSANALARLGAFAILILMLAAALNLGSSAKSAAGKRSAAVPPAEAASNNSGKEAASPSALTHMALPFTLAPTLPQVTGPSIETYNCATDVAQDVFELGDTVCARATGVPAAAFPEFSWRVFWVDPAGLVVEKDTAATDPTTQYDYPLPTTDTSNIGGAGGITINNRGTWRALLARSNGSIIATAYFTVRSTPRPVADVYVQKFAANSNTSIGSGDLVKFIVVVANIGPNDAANVHVTDSLPGGASLDSFLRVNGPQCVVGASPQDCTIATLASGERAEFEAVYVAGAIGTYTTTATATTDTNELDTNNNTGTGTFDVVTGSSTENTCSLHCPNDIVVTATELDGNNQKGATVQFEAEPTGDCGAVSSTPASGTFFTVGTHNISSTASGGGSCSFTVTVIDPDTLPAPAITCPADTGAVAASGAVDASVNTGTPTTTGTVLSVTSIRSDGVARAVTDPYSVGETVITWTARDQAADENGQFPPLTRTASCQQKIVVTSNDVPTISCPTDKTFAAPSGSCEVTLTEAQIGTPTATGLGLGPNDPPAAGVGVVGVRSDRQALTAPFPGGQTVITWTATDTVGRVVSCTQTITVTTSGDNMPPVLNVPDDVVAFTDSCTAVVDDELGVATATDSCGGGVKISRTGVPTGPVLIRRRFPLPPLIVQRETFIFPVGTTIITYTATDSSGNVTTGTQKVTVKERAVTPPTIALNGPAAVTVECHTSFTDPGATASDNCGAATITQTGSVDVNTPGTYVINYTATDASGNTASVERTVTVVDTIAPVITMNGPAAVTVECHTSFTDPGASAADSCDTSVPVGVNNPVDVNVPGTYTITYSASDDSGNPAASVTRTVTVVDTTPPVMSCPADIVVTLPLNTTAVSMPVTFAAPTAADSCDTSVPVATSHTSGSIFGVGTTTVTATATDDSGNPASCSFNVTVLYNFTGFFSPISNTVINQANAGRTIPVKFSLSGNKGLNIFAADSPFSRQVPCSAETVNDVTLVETTGNSSLTYSPDQYHFNWKTESSWAGTCRELVVKLNDGSEHTARFKFK